MLRFMVEGDANGKNHTSNRTIYSIRNIFQLGTLFNLEFNHEKSTLSSF